MKKTTILAMTAGALGTVGALALPFTRSGYESPAYEVVVSDGAFEVRDYPSMTVAVAPMGDNKGNRNSAFRMLFGYISGKNNDGKKIAMTTPVFTSSSGKGQEMSFVVPEEVAKTGTPEATDTKVEIAERKEGRFATYRFSGNWSDEKAKQAKTKLLKWVSKQGLKTIGEIEKANYDPPFTPPALRRNEVLIRIHK